MGLLLAESAEHGLGLAGDRSECGPIRTAAGKDPEEDGDFIAERVRSFFGSAARS